MNNERASERRRILLTIPSITSYHTFLKELVAELIARDIEAHLATDCTPIRGLDCYGAQPLCRTHHVSFPRGASPLLHIRAALQMRNVVANVAPSLVHCHFGVTAFTAAVGRQTHWPTTIATVQGLMFPQIGGWRRALFGACERWSHRRLDGLWVLTQCDLEALQKKRKTTNVFVQHSHGFGCCIEKFKPGNWAESNLSSLRSALGIHRNDFVFIFIGRQVYFKGFAVLVRAFLTQFAARNDVKLLLVGARDPIHPTGLTAAEETSLKETRNVIATGWQEDVAQYLALARVNVFPSVREGMPVNLMESLAMGVPVITVDSRGCRDVVRDGVDGVVLPNAEPITLARAMVRLANEQNTLKELSVNALEGRTRFDRNLWIAEQLEIYQRLMSGASISYSQVR